MKPASPIWIGHRGFGEDRVRGGSPRENTVESFALAFARGADEVETDLALSRDGRIFLQHDARIPTPRGPLPASRLAFADIAALRPGTALLLDALEAFPGRAFVLELKRHTDGAAVLAALRHPDLARHVERFRFISFEYGFLLAAARAFPDVPRAWIATCRVGRFDPVVRARHVRQCARDGVTEICAHWRLLFGPVARMARDAGLDIGLGPVNSPAALARSLKLGATRIYTDRLELRG